MASAIEIISDAFVLLGKQAVSSPLTDNPIFSGVQDIYDRLVPAVLTHHPWRFAIKNFELSQVDEPSPFERWSNVFLLPAEELLIWRTDPIINYEIFENKLYTNQSEVKLEFLFRASESTFPPYFTRYLTFQLAADVAMTVTQNPTLASFWEKKAEVALINARALDSSIMPQTPIVRDAIWSSHFGAGRSEFIRTR